MSVSLDTLTVAEVLGGTFEELVAREHDAKMALLQVEGTPGLSHAQRQAAWDAWTATGRALKLYEQLREVSQ